MDQSDRNRTVTASPAATPTAEPVARVPGRGSRAGRALRLGAYAALVVVGLGAASLKSAAARTRDSLDGMGEELIDHADELGPTTAVTVNGAAMYGGARHVDLDVETVLSRVAAYCDHPSPEGERDWLDKSLEPSVAGQPSGDDARVQIGSVRRRGNETGSVVCVKSSHAGKGLTPWVSGMRDFAETGDVGAVGKVRYVVARRSQTQGTQVAAIWTEGPFDVRSMVASSGDVPGADIAGLPRPANSRRILSAEVVGGHYGVRSYDVSGPLEQALAGYDAQMSQAGWRRIGQDLRQGGETSAAARELDRTSRAFVQQGVSIIVDAAEEPEGGTRIDIVQMGDGREGRIGPAQSRP